MSVFEICDTSSNECYYTIGLFSSFEEAKNEIEKRLSKNKPISFHNDDNEYEKIEIVECGFGWGDKRKSVFCVEREPRIDEKTDEFLWVTLNI